LNGGKKKKQQKKLGFSRDIKLGYGYNGVYWVYDDIKLGYKGYIIGI